MMSFLFRVTYCNASLNEKCFREQRTQLSVDSSYLRISTKLMYNSVGIAIVHVCTCTDMLWSTILLKKIFSQIKFSWSSVSPVSIQQVLKLSRDKIFVVYTCTYPAKTTKILGYTVLQYYNDLHPHKIAELAQNFYSRCHITSPVV